MYFWGRIAEAGKEMPYSSKGKRGMMRQFVVETSRGGSRVALMAFKEDHIRFLNDHVGKTVKVCAKWDVYWNDSKSLWYNNMRYISVECDGEVIKQ